MVWFTGKHQLKANQRSSMKIALEMYSHKITAFYKAPCTTMKIMEMRIELLLRRQHVEIAHSHWKNTLEVNQW